MEGHGVMGLYLLLGYLFRGRWFVSRRTQYCIAELSLVVMRFFYGALKHRRGGGVV